MRITLNLVSALAVLAMLYGAIVVGFAFPGFYMVAFEGVKPGEPMYPEALAPTLAESGSQLARGGGILIAAVVARVLVSRQLRSMSAQVLPPHKSLERTREE